MKVRKILIANRGEIAVRVIRACREMNIDSVAVYSTADRDSLHVREAQEAVCIGPPKAAASYLNQDAVIEAALITGCDAIHPGYGFLSENSAFARKCEENGLIFIGPKADVIDMLGNKAAARTCVKAADVPTVPGSDGAVKDAAEGLSIAKKIGFPVLIKASAGGGGRGIRRVDSEDAFEKAFSEARAEAKACFGDDEMYIEKLIVNPKHVEIQILADEAGNVVYLGERDCSIQRKNQKLMEESPCPILDDDTRKAMGQAAVNAAKAAGYTSAGTVEFVLDKDKHFYFIEMNTRIQVEHPVTEAVTGIDLIREQIKVAYHSKLSFKQEDVKLNGHSIECRINAEDPHKGFMPNTGTIEALNLPGGPGVRVDTHIYQGYTVNSWYDSMMAKIIVHAPDRLSAIRRMRRALEELVTDGVKTTCDFDYLVTFHSDYIRGNYDVGFMEKNTDEILSWDV